MQLGERAVAVRIAGRRATSMRLCRSSTTHCLHRFASSRFSCTPHMHTVRQASVQRVRRERCVGGSRARSEYGRVSSAHSSLFSVVPPCTSGTPTVRSARRAACCSVRSGRWSVRLGGVRRLPSWRRQSERRTRASSLRPHARACAHSTAVPASPSGTSNTSRSDPGGSTAARTCTRRRAHRRACSRDSPEITRGDDEESTRGGVSDDAGRGMRTGGHRDATE